MSDKAFDVCGSAVVVRQDLDVLDPRREERPLGIEHIQVAELTLAIAFLGGVEGLLRLGQHVVLEDERLGVGRVALSRLLNGATGISPEMALRLSKALSTSPEFWYGMQVNYDLWQAKKKFRG